MKNLKPDTYFGITSVLYNLYHLRDLASADFFEALPERLKYGSTGQELQKIIDPLEWAMDSIDFDFKNILPNIRFSNSQIIPFMEKYLEVIKSSFDLETISAMKIPSDERKLRVLIVDDWLAGYSVANLSGRSYDLVPASDIVSAIAKFSKQEFAIVLLSLRFPKDNLEFLTRLKKICEQDGRMQIPILTILNSEQPANIEKLYELGCSKHLFWPVARYLLLQEIYKLTT